MANNKTRKMIHELLTRLGEEKRTAPNSDEARHVAVCFTHVEEAMLRYNTLPILTPAPPLEPPELAAVSE